MWDARTGEDVASIQTPGEVYSIVSDRADERIAIATDGAALVWRATSYTGDIAKLRKLAACRTTFEVYAGTLRQRPIDAAACNQQ